MSKTVKNKDGEETTKNCAGRMFSCIVRNRKESTLLPLIKKYIAPGSIIISDMWKAYDKIADLEGSFYDHLTVNHSKEFKNKANGACTNTIEGAWRTQLKSQISVRNYSRFCLGEYLNKRMWIKENWDSLWESVWGMLSATEYEKICHIRSGQGGSWKKKHEEDKKIRLEELRIDAEAKRMKKMRREARERKREAAKRKRDFDQLEARKKNKCLTYFLSPSK